MHSPQLAALLGSTLVGPANVGARPAAAGDGIDITSWKSGAFSPRVALVLIDGDQALNINSPAGGANGAEVWGRITVGGASKWKLIGYLNSSAAVPIASATLGYVAELDDLAPFDRLLIAGTPSVGAPTYSFVALETWR